MLYGWTLPIGEAASGRVCACSLRSWLVSTRSCLGRACKVAEGLDSCFLLPVEDRTRVVTVVTKQLCTPKNLTYLKPTYLPTYVTVVAVETVVTVVTKKTFFTKELFSQEFFFCFTKKFLHTKNCATSSHKK